jgi:hypothetical protein
MCVKNGGTNSLGSFPAKKGTVRNNGRVHCHLSTSRFPVKTSIHNVHEESQYRLVVSTMSIVVSLRRIVPILIAVITAVISSIL